METVTIIAKKDLYNGGKCFTKGHEYEVKSWHRISEPASLMEKVVTNDQGEQHTIGSWWRNFKIKS